MDKLKYVYLGHIFLKFQPLRVLLEKDTEWHWTTQQEQALHRLKKMMKVLRPFKAHKDLVHASSKGMGTVLLQDEQPIAYASKSLTLTQQNYAQIERRCLLLYLGATSSKTTSTDSLGYTLRQIINLLKVS